MTWPGSRISGSCTDPFIANLDVRTAHSITLSGLDDGCFSITNMRTGVVKHYAAK